MSKPHYAVEIFTNTTLTNATYGIVNGVFRFITDRPGYDLSTVIPTYGPDEIDTTGASIGGNNVPYVFVEGFFTKDSITSNHSKSIDISSFGNYSTDSQFAFKVRNDVDFATYCNDNGINLTNSKCVFWIVIDDIFYQRARGRVVNNPGTEIDYEFQIDDDAKMIHKNLPPNVSVLPAADAPNSAITQGDPVPVVFGNVPYSKILKNNGDNYVLPLNSPHTPAASTSWLTYTDYHYILDLVVSVSDFIASDSRLVGKYLSVVAGQFGGSSVNIDRVYKIIDNFASVFAYGAFYKVTLVIESQLVSSTAGDSSGDVLMSLTDFNNLSLGYALVGSGPFVGGAKTWWFQVSDYAVKSWVSNNPVSVSNIYEYEKNANVYNDVSSVLKLEQTSAPAIQLTANTATKDGKTTVYERVALPMSGYGTTSGGSVYDLFTSSGDISIVTDQIRHKTPKTMTLVLSSVTSKSYGIDYTLFARYTPQPIQPAFKNQVLANSYSSLYFCIDFDIFNFTPGAKISVGALYFIATDIYGNKYDGTASPSGSDAEAIALSGSGDAPFNFTPNTLLLDNNNPYNTDLTNKFGTLAKGSNTYRYVLKLIDADPSVFASAQITSVELRLPIWYINGSGVSCNIKIKQIMIVGERSIDTITADLFARTAGELTGVTAGPVAAGPTYPDGSHSVGDVYHALIHILEDYDGIPTSMIDYGTLKADRFTSLWAVSRTLTEQKNSVEYLNELCAQSFVGMFSGRTGKRVLRVFQGFGGTLTPTTGYGKTSRHDSALIVDKSIQALTKTDINNVYNSFLLQYAFDPGSNNFLRSFNIANVDKSAFPALSTPDPNDSTKPLWWSYFCGLPADVNDWTLNYTLSAATWAICHAAYLKNGVVRLAQSDCSSLDWFGDSLIWSGTDTSCTATTSTAYLLLQLLVAWCTIQKDTIPYSIPINANTYGTELLDVVTFNDIIYSNGIDRNGWIVGIETDTGKDQFNLQLMLQP